MFLLSVNMWFVIRNLVIIGGSYYFYFMQDADSRVLHITQLIANQLFLANIKWGSMNIAIKN